LVNPNRSFRLPFAPVFAIIVIFMLALLLFFAAWPSVGEMALLCVPGLGFFFYYEYKNYQGQIWPLLKSGSWLLLFMLGVSLICYFGNNKHVAHNVLTLQTSIILLAILSVFSFIYGVFSAYKGEA
ncbi:MAG: hypothetical protein ACK4M7_02090, partial [Burkholderiales bacterium]